MSLENVQPNWGYVGSIKVTNQLDLVLSVTMHKLEIKENRWALPDFCIFPIHANNKRLF